MPDLQPVAIPGFQIVHGDQLRSAHMDVVRWSLGHPPPAATVQGGKESIAMDEANLVSGGVQ
jgi:hypothetical protein